MSGMTFHSIFDAPSISSRVEVASNRSAPHTSATPSVTSTSSRIRFVTDPPYELTTARRSEATRFMGMKWDGSGVAFDPAVWAAIGFELNPEYVEIAKSFFDGPEPGFVNAALDRIAHDARA